MIEHVIGLLKTTALAFGLDGPAHLWQRLEAMRKERHRRRVAYRELQSMDENALHDIGLSHRSAAQWRYVRDPM